MQELEDLKRALRFPENCYTHMNVCRALETILKRYKITKDVRVKLKHYLLEIEKLEYYCFWSHSIDRHVMMDFIVLVTEIIEYLEMFEII